MLRAKRLKEQNEMEMKKLLIIGAGGHGRVVADIALKMNAWQEIALLDDNETIQYALGFKVIGGVSRAFALIGEYDIFIAVGNNTVREKIHQQLKAAGATVPILIHPSATIGAQVEIGEGTVVMAGAVINCGSKIGECCIVNTGATVDHDDVIGNYVHISPGAHLAGTVNVGQSTWIGLGVAVSNNVEITVKTVVGAGAVVVKNITEAGIYTGVPARRVSNGKFLDTGK